MDWFMLTAMVIAGWAILSVIAGERIVRHNHLVATAVPQPPARTTDPTPTPAPAAAPATVGPRLAA